MSRNALMPLHYRIGYTTGVFDMLHAGHVRLLQRARLECSRLIVGVASDELCESRKGKRPLQPVRERMEIVAAIRHVDDVVRQDSFDNIADHERLGFHVIFKGDDWQGHPEWVALEEQMSARGVAITFLPYTPGISSTILREHYAADARQ